MINCPNFKAIFNEEKNFLKVVFDEDEAIKVDFGEVSSVAEVTNPYQGEYNIVPKMTEQILPTRGKVLSENVKVYPVPIYRVTNTGGGTTVYIANEV